MNLGESNNSLCSERKWRERGWVLLWSGGTDKKRGGRVCLEGGGQRLGVYVITGCRLCKGFCLWNER